MTTTTRKDRNLGYLEKYQTSKHLTRCYGNITMTLELQHEARNEQVTTFYKGRLQPSLTKLVERHAALSMVVREKDQKTAHFAQLSTIDLAQVVTIVDKTVVLKDVIKEETDKEFDLDSLLPLWRISVIAKGDSSCTLVLTMHHIIGDGMSLTIFIKELLQGLGQEVEAEDIIQLKENKLQPPYEECNAPAVSIFWDVLPAVIKNFVPKLLPASIARMIDSNTDSWKGDFAVKEGEIHDTHVETVHVKQDIWKPILVECKKRGISGHAILFAAMMLAWHKIYPEHNVEASTPTNCRVLCNPPVRGDQIGNYVGSYTSHWTNKQLAKETLWNLATNYYADLQKNKDNSGKEALFLKYLPDYPASYIDFWYDKKNSNSFKKTGGLELSDLGKMTYKSKWNINEVYFCQSAHLFTTAFGVSSISINDELFCTLGWQQDTINQDKIKNYQDIFIDVLQS